MSTIKISQLPAGSVIQANTQNTIFAGVDLVAGTTYAYSAKVLATGLYSNTSLVVGQNQSLFPNTIAQFSLSGASYVQTNFVNLDGRGTADHVITANNGTDSTYFLDLGLTNPAYQPGFEYNNIGTAVSPLDGYLYVQGGTTSGLLGGNLIVGTTTTGTQIKFIVAGGTASNIVAKMISTGLVMNGSASITTSNLYATGNVVTNTITTPSGSGSNLVIDPDGLADVIFPANTELFIQSTAAATGINSGAVQVAGGISVTGNVYSGNVYTGSLIATGNVTAGYLYGNAVSSTLSTVGTWTPNVQFTTQGTVTYTANTGSFVKTGRQVSAYFTLSASTSGSSGNMSIANLPFSSATTAGTVGITTIVGSVIGPSSGNMGYISGNVSSGASSTQLYVTVNTGNGSLTNEPVTGGTGTGGIGTPFTISGVISYISAS
jgi:hypothetical protein